MITTTIFDLYNGKFVFQNYVIKIAFNLDPGIFYSKIIKAIIVISKEIFNNCIYNSRLIINRRMQGNSILNRFIAGNGAREFARHQVGNADMTSSHEIERRVYMHVTSFPGLLLVANAIIKHQHLPYGGDWWPCSLRATIVHRIPVNRSRDLVIVSLVTIL